MAKGFIGSLLVKLGLDSAAFVANSKRAKKETTGLAKAMDGVKSSLAGAGKSLRNFAAALGVAVSVGGLTALISSTVNAADNINNLSVKINASTEALSEYKYVAEQTGITFTTLTTAWQRQTRRIADAAAGTGEAKLALQQLGLSAFELARLKPEEQFERIAEAMRGVTLESKQVSLAQKIWDTEGVAVLQTVKEGSKAIQQYREEARKLGLTLTKEQAQAATQANQAMARIKYTMTTMSHAVLPPLADALEKVSRWLMDSGTSSDFFKNAFDFLIKSINTGVYAFKSLSAIGGAALDILNTEVNLKTWDNIKLIFKETNAELEEFKKSYFASITEINNGPNVTIAPPVVEDDMQAHVDAWREHQQALMQITDDAHVQQYYARQAFLDSIDLLESQRVKDRLSTAASFFSAMASLSEGASKSDFKRTKNLMRAETILSTYASAQYAYLSTLKYGGTVFQASLAAASATLAGIARLNKINETKFNSSSTPSTSAGATVAGGSPGDSITGEGPLGARQGAQDQARSIVQIQFYGDVYGADDFEERVVRAVENKLDSDRIIIHRNTAQAEALV